MLAAYGLERDESGRWTGQGRDIRVEGTSWQDNGPAQGHGRTTIHLVTYLRQCDYREAVAWLKQTFGVDQIVAAMMVDARFQAQTMAAGAAPHNRRDSQFIAREQVTIWQTNYWPSEDFFIPQLFII